MEVEEEKEVEVEVAASKSERHSLAESTASEWSCSLQPRQCLGAAQQPHDWLSGAGALGAVWLCGGSLG